MPEPARCVRESYQEALCDAMSIVGVMPIVVCALFRFAAASAGNRFALQPVSNRSQIKISADAEIYLPVGAARSNVLSQQDNETDERRDHGCM